MDLRDLQNRFTYHPPRAENDQPARYELVPDSREKSLAITHLEEAVFWANAAIARNE